LVISGGGQHRARGARCLDALSQGETQEGRRRKR
jgi:hypothetical protein